MEEYGEVKNEEVELTSEQEETVLEGLSPLERIQHAAKKFNVPIREPKKSCKHCHGRGYTGFKSGPKKEPVPCKCIYPKMNAMTELAFENRNQYAINRKQRRQYEKIMRRG
jgi:hypothetical protein